MKKILLFGIVILLLSSFVSALTETHGVDFTTLNIAQDVCYGLRISPLNDLIIYNLTGPPDAVDYDHAYIFNSTYGLIANTTNCSASNICYFSGDNLILLNTGETYYIMVDNDGTTFKIKYGGSFPALPYLSDNINWSGRSATNSAGQSCNEFPTYHTNYPTDLNTWEYIGFELETINASNFTITAKDIYTDDSINSFSVEIDGINYTTTTGTITTNILSNNISTYNISVFNTTGYFNRDYIDYDVSTNLIAYLSPLTLPKTIMDFTFDSIQVVENTSYQSFYYGEFTPENKQAYLSNQIEVFSETNGSYYCRTNINNSNYGSEFYFNTKANEITQLKFLSNVFTPLNDKYTLQLDCKKEDTLQPDLYIIQYAGYLKQSESLDVDKSNFTTTKESYFNIDYQEVSTTTRLIQYDGYLYFENNTDSIQTAIDFDGVSYIYNVTDEYLFFTRLLQPTSTDGNITTTFTTNYTGVTEYQVGYSESIIQSSEYDFDRSSLPFTMSASDYANVTNFVPVSDSVFVKTDLTISSEETQDIGIKLWSVDEEYIFTRTVNKGDYTIPVFGVFENISNNVYLQVYATEQNATLLDYNLTQQNVSIVDFNKDELLIYAFDGYKNENLQNLSAWIYGTQYKTEDGELKLYVQSDEIDFIFGSTQNGGYVNKTYTNFNTSNYLNASFYQTNITLIFKHRTTNETILDPVGVTDVENSYYFNTNLTNNTFNFPLDLGYILINSSRYVSANESLNLTLGEVSTIYITLSPIINFSFYDERTNEPFNMTSPDEIRVQVTCLDKDEVLDVIINNETTELNLTCRYEKIKFNVDYGVDGGSYYRTYPNLEEVFGIDEFTFRVWLLDLDNTNVIYNSFRVYDLFGEFENPQVLLYKIIGDQEWLITGETVDAESKISAFLIQNDEYTIKVLSDNQPERIMGSYFAALAGETTIRLFDIDLDSDLSEFNSQVSHYIYLVNESGNLIVRGALNDTGDNVESVRFVVRETDDSGTIICDQTSSTNDVEFSCDVPDDATGYFYAKMYITGVDESERLIDKMMKSSELIPLPFEFESEESQNYLFFFIILIVGFSATIFTSPLLALMLVGFMFFLKMTGWFQVSTIASTSTGNAQIATAFIAVTSLITLLYFLRRGKQ